MGAGILPVAVDKSSNRIYFLLGKENQYADTPGWSDFGGGTDPGETQWHTACREGEEELTGFLGTHQEIAAHLRQRPLFWLAIPPNYRMYLYPIEYDPNLPTYYNRNHRLLEERLSPTVIKREKIFEKEEIRWVAYDDLPQMRSLVRPYFTTMIDTLLERRPAIQAFLRKKRQTRRKR
jgi:hypothetical protein